MARAFKVIHRGKVYWLSYQSWTERSERLAHEAAAGIPAKARPVLVISEDGAD